MALVNDPNFWKRFSVAVHNSDAEKEEMAKRPDLKHSYVISLEASDNIALLPLATPTSQTPLRPTPLEPVALRPFSPSPPLSPPLHEVKGRSTTPPQTPPKRLKKSKPSKSPRRPSLTHIHAPFMRHTNSSHLSLSLSGRPPSRFKFWTSVTADPSNRDSWLEGQRRKRKQRTWICWAFWLGLMFLVGGVVAAVLVLRARGII